MNAFYAPCNEELVLLKGPLLTEVGFIEGFNKRSLELTLPIPFCPKHADSSLMLLSDIILLFYYYYALFFFFFSFLAPNSVFISTMLFLCNFFGFYCFFFTDPRKIFMILKMFVRVLILCIMQTFMWCLLFIYFFVCWKLRHKYNKKNRSCTLSIEHLCCYYLHRKYVPLML